MKQRARQEIPKGTKFGVLTFLHEEPPVKQNNVWRRLAMVKCICGEEKLVQLANLQSKTVKSCGKQACMVENKRREMAAINAAELYQKNKKRAELLEQAKKMGEQTKYEFIASSFAQLGQEELMKKSITEMHYQCRVALGRNPNEIYQ